MSLFRSFASGNLRPIYIMSQSLYGSSNIEFETNTPKYGSCNLEKNNTKDKPNDHNANSQIQSSGPNDLAISCEPATILKRKKSDKSNTILFWAQDPNALLQPTHVFEFFPTETMTYNQKLNAITRTVLILTAITFVYSRSTRLLAIASVTLLAIFLLYFSQLHNKNAKQVKFVEEAFQAGDINPETGKGFIGAGYLAADPVLGAMGDRHVSSSIKTSFLPPDSPNPLGNVLLTDYDFNPNKQPAPPAYSGQVNNDILTQTKKMIAQANPGQPDIVDKLFGDLGDQFAFEQSMQPFYSTANTMIPNDQGGFIDFCYGDMVSCKEGNMFACARNGPPRYHQ